jgi:hypothetical protein
MTLVVNHSSIMDIHSFNKKLSKISIIIDSLDDGGNLSPLERDLLLSYIRDLYDLALDGQAPSKPKPAPVQIEKPVEPIVVAQARVVTPQAAPEPVAKEMPVATPTVEKVVEAIVPAVVAKEEAPKTEVKIDPVIPHLSLDLQTEDVRELFTIEKANDFSEKLSLTPIKDLTKSMGINERVLVLQELFGNNKDFFAETLEKLNGMSGFDEATSFIINTLIPKYDWTADKRAKHATHFIKLVRRRYI